MKKRITLAIMAVFLLFCATGCTDGYYSDTTSDKAYQIESANVLSHNQPTPTDIEYSLERYNLIRRAYWVNGQSAKADALICPVPKPLGYIVLFSGNAVVGSFVVDGKVSSLNSFLTPDSEYYEVCSGEYTRYNRWISDVDGSYGENDNGIFFFTANGNYVEWNGEYLYSDIPFEVADPVVKYEVN